MYRTFRWPCSPFVILALSLMSLNVAIIAAQDPQLMTAPPKYYYEVVGTSTVAPNTLRTWSEPYPTEAAATERLNEILREHAPGGLLATDPEHPLHLKVSKKLKNVQEAKSAVDKAKDMLQGKEREVGATLKEYQAQIETAWNNVMNVKKTLSQQTQKITVAQLDNANNLVTQYNGSRDQFAAAFGADSRLFLTRYSALPKMSEKDFGKKDEREVASKKPLESDDPTKTSQNQPVGLKNTDWTVSEVVGDGGDYRQIDGATWMFYSNERVEFLYPNSMQMYRSGFDVKVKGRNIEIRNNRANYLWMTGRISDASDTIVLSSTDKPIKLVLKLRKGLDRSRIIDQAIKY